MHIPRIWARAQGTHPKEDIPVIVWGWGDDDATAGLQAQGRLERLLARLSRGEPFPARYLYANRPVREEILRVIDGEAEPAAMITRNGYGAEVLNAARMLFLDIDAPPPRIGFLKKLFGGKPEPDGALDKLRDALRRAGGVFRIYRTAGGYRVIGAGREFDPAGADTQALMTATATDPQFAQLCRAQKSFRARLTPKPWRCGSPNPPGCHPREGRSAERFATWLPKYQERCRAYATCAYLETVGAAGPSTGLASLIELHDRATRAAEKLPLA